MPRPPVTTTTGAYRFHWRRCRSGAEYGIFEVGMNHFGELRTLVGFVRPHLALVTTIAPAHLEFFGNCESIADAKSEIFEGVEPGGFALIPSDSPYAARLMARARQVQVAQVVSFGTNGDAKLLSFASEGDGMRIRCDILGRAVDCYVGAPGGHIAQNVVGALAAVALLDGDVLNAAAALKNFTALKGRGARFIHEAIGDQLTCIFVDHGLLRTREAEEVVRVFRDRFNIRLVHRDAADMFLGELEGVEDPELKRKTIGRLFIDVFEEEATKLGGADFLAQGTLYPDVIESVSFTGGPSVTIKSHHNVGGLPARMRMQLVEPLRELFKDEVRRLGLELGLPPAMVGRHPFPGPGLAIRIPGAITREKLDLLRRADAIFLEELRLHNLYDAIWQAFAVLLPVRTVGVMGDGRTYDLACALRAVTSTDGMTADVYPFEVPFLARVANRIVNEVRGINRVTYDITSKPPGTIEWE